MGRLPGPPSTNVTLRIDDEALARIDHSAEQAGETRTAYILNWLPEFYDAPPRTRARNATNSPNGDTNNTRVSARSESGSRAGA